MIVKAILSLALSIPAVSFGQELFAFSEPASNMAARSIGLRLNNRYFLNSNGGKLLQLNPEVMWGVSKNLMIHGDVYFTDRGGYAGTSAYMKYRVFSEDDVHNHFRIALFGRLSKASSSLVQPNVDLAGMNTGIEIGSVATKLVNKVAMSVNVSFLQASHNNQSEVFHEFSNKAVSYSFSAGKLMLPKEYTDYKQLNVNLMVELLGQTNLGDGSVFLDAAPSLQLIILSKMRVDLGYRLKVLGNMERLYDRNFLLRLEYNIFNVYK